jgi:hypothetical protein
MGHLKTSAGSESQLAVLQLQEGAECASPDMVMMTLVQKCVRKMPVAQLLTHPPTHPPRAYAPLCSACSW